jgi:hypothetical protein
VSNATVSGVLLVLNSGTLVIQYYFLGLIRRRPIYDWVPRQLSYTAGASGAMAANQPDAAGILAAIVIATTKL